MAPFTSTCTEYQQCSSAPAVAPQPTKPEPFCSFCLRERPANVKFYKHVIGCSHEMRTALQSMLGYDFNLTNFAICKPCWKVMQLVQDFRLRCFQANEVVQRVTKGLSNVGDGWFSAKNLAMIESVRMSIEDQMQHIGKINVTRRMLELDDSADEEPATEDKLELETQADGSSDVTDEVAELSYDVTGEVKGSSESVVEVAEPQQTPIQMTEAQPKKHECANCQKTYTTKKGLRSHAVHCVLGLPPADYFKEHLKKHGSIATFQCRQNCDKLFFSEPVRAHHERICGENVRNLDCATCGRRCKNRQQLRIHQWCRHSENARIYPCDVCGRMFKQQTAVALHKKTHLAEKPYGCEMCPMKYIWKRSLNHHVKKVHAK